jgi:alpha-beta hydrolase superfamily lysophospholipase
MVDYSSADTPSILTSVFFPHNYRTPVPEQAFDLTIPVDEGVTITCRFHKGGADWPWILFFHGNGEVASDYDDIASYYLERKLNLVVADYRGYGASTGSPTLTHLVADARPIYRSIRAELASRGLRDDFWVMGRSLGSTSALELAHQYQEEIRGLIIESGFLNILRVLVHLDIPTGDVPLQAIDRQCIDMIGEIRLPTLIIHGEMDNIVPLSEAELLYEQIGAKDKELVVIPEANHNDIMSTGTDQYFDALQRFVKKTAQNA